MNRFCLPVLGVLLIASHADAQYCGSYRYGYNYGYSNYYYQPTYVREYIVPVYVQSFLATYSPIQFVYAGGYNVSAATVTTTATAVPTVQQPGVVMPQGATTVKQGFTKEQLQQLRGVVEDVLKEKAPSIYQGSPPPIPGAKATVEERYQPVSFRTTDEQPQEENYLTVLTAHCAECHSGSRAKGGFTLFNTDGSFHHGWSAAAVWNVIEKGQMPPSSRPQLSSSHKLVLGKAFKVAGY